MILLIDNYDSFTWNLAHRLAELGAEVRVARNDALGVAEALALKPQAIVLSPGPRTPDQAGISLDLVRAAPPGLPMLGVCLGHQAIGQALGGRVVAARAIIHGKVSEIHHDGSALFAGVADPFHATRYHSLALDRASLTAAFAVTAWTGDGEVMAISHAERPLCGVQFHPESIATEAGYAILANFLALSGVRPPVAA